MADKCQICGSVEKLTKHHLIPQVKCHNKYKKIKNDESNFIRICDLCHRTIHAYYDENTLRDNYNTLEKLLSAENLQVMLSGEKSIWIFSQIPQNNLKNVVDI